RTPGCNLRESFIFRSPATSEIYALSLHDALPIWLRPFGVMSQANDCPSSRSVSAALKLSTSLTRPTSYVESFFDRPDSRVMSSEDRKSTRLNSSHSQISYAVFCLKKKTETHNKDP